MTIACGHRCSSMTRCGPKRCGSRRQFGYVDIDCRFGIYDMCNNCRKIPRAADFPSATSPVQLNSRAAQSYLPGSVLAGPVLAPWKVLVVRNAGVGGPFGQQMPPYQCAPAALPIPEDPGGCGRYHSRRRTGIDIDRVAVAAPVIADRLDLQCVIPRPDQPAVFVGSNGPGRFVDVEDLDGVPVGRENMECPQPCRTTLTGTKRLGTAGQRRHAEQSPAHMEEGRRRLHRTPHPAGLGRQFGLPRYGLHRTSHVTLFSQVTTILRESTSGDYSRSTDRITITPTDRFRPRKQPGQQRAVRTQQWILEAAAHIFAEYGYAAGTTNRIAERAGVSVGSLYQYFPNKDALLRALMDSHIDAARRLLIQRLADGVPERVDDILRLFIRATIDNHRDAPRLHRVLFEEAPRSPQVLARLHEMEQFAVTMVAGLLDSLPGVAVADSTLSARNVVAAV